MRAIILATLVASALAAASAPAEDSLDFTGRIGPVGAGQVFRDPGYYVWCGSAIRGEDGKTYLFYSRWKVGAEGREPGDETLFKDMKGWLKYCEIAAAVAEAPGGPFRPLGTVLKGTGDRARWDFVNAHNPHVQRFGGKVYLYHVSVNPVENKDRWMQYADGQRIGVAVADSVADLVAGRYRRCDRPLIAPDGRDLFCRTVNPAVCQGRDGKFLLLFKTRSAPTGGHMAHWVATADKPDGPFRLAGSALTEARYSAEDPYLWFDRKRDRYYAIVKDFSQERALSPQFGALALITSEKGWGDWKPAAHPLVSLRQFTDLEGKVHPLANLERPQLLLDDQGRPVCLYAAAGEADPFKGTPSFNLALPLRPTAGP